MGMNPGAAASVERSSQPNNTHSAVGANVVFVNYTDPAHFKNKAHRRDAQAFLSRTYGRKHQRIVIQQRSGLRRPRKVAENVEKIENGVTVHKNVELSPQELLGAGRLDPFNVYSAQDLPLFVHEVLDHGELTLTSSLRATYPSCPQSI